MAAALAGTLAPGDVVLLSGELGAGKTTFVRGACRALGIVEPVTSPTFTIGRRYRAGRPRDHTSDAGPVRRDPASGVDPVLVSHLDLYRLASLADEDPGLLDDYLTPDAIAFVEWPAVAGEGLSRFTARVTIEHAGGDERVITIDRPDRPD